METVAYLCARNHSQVEIANLLDMSQSRVSRMRQQALESGLLKTQIQFEAKRVGEERLREIELRLQPRGLFERIRERIPLSRERLRSVRIFDSGAGGAHEEGTRHGRHRFASLAAPFVAETLRGSTVVGVAWGSTIGHIVEALEGMNLKPSAGKGPQFCPLAGEPMRHTGLRFSSSRLAARLAELFESKGEPTPSLAGVPALMPQSFKDGEVATLKMLLGRFDDYARVFGRPEMKHDPDALVHRVDTIFTGAGPADHALGHPEEDALIRGGEIVRSELEPLIFGDLCGVLLLRPNLSDEKLTTIDRIRVRWAGIDESTLERCAKRSPEHGGAGVLAACVGRKSQEVVFEALRRGLVNHLIIDRPLADALESRLLEAAEATRPRPIEEGRGTGLKDGPTRLKAGT